MLWSPYLQLHYPFENQANDYSGNARHGTVNGSGVYATKPNGGRCLYFDGTVDKVTTPNFGLTGTVLVFDCWIKGDFSTLAYQAVLADAVFQAAFDFIYIGGKAPNRCLFAYADGATAIEASVANYFAAPYLDTWLHLCIVADYSGKSLYFYRNAILVATVAMTGTPLFPSTSRVKYIGSYDAGGNDILTDAYLKDVRLWTLTTMPAAAHMLANVNRLMLGLNPIW